MVFLAHENELEWAKEHGHGKILGTIQTNTKIVVMAKKSVNYILKRTKQLPKSKLITCTGAYAVGPGTGEGEAIGTGGTG